MSAEFHHETEFFGASTSALAELVHKPRRARPIVMRSLVAAVVFVITMAFMPWVQNVPGTGSVVAYDPSNREQPVEATISGRIEEWLVQEGQFVDAGTPIVRLTDNDPNMIQRLALERSAAEFKVTAREQRTDLLRNRVENVRLSSRAYEATANAELRVAQQSLETKRQDLRAAEAALATNRLQQQRLERLGARGLTSERDLELATLAVTQGESDVQGKQAALRAAANVVETREAETERVRRQAQADIESAEASLREAESSLADARAELARLDVGISRQAARVISAPSSGIVTRISARGANDQVSPGQTLAILVPDNDDRAVELYVDGNNASMLAPGTEVRLQFEGWPAVQFSGWPSVAVGTFPGRVIFVDPIDDGYGDFRVLIGAQNEGDWPDATYLRQGVRAKGWFLLDEVSVGYELWRQFNGFPPLAAQGRHAPSSSYRMGE